ncbi:MAG: hypothetical protein DRH12_01900 [Deltaproteobacteria bacterium]|nr:MAG: hypothetical protein DRH12_01900 [Deltaproteobacteria bacterium]RLB76567.1 MAG: hypothetical protein DRH15_12475 [Deltaproteobacteria bacterium]
MAEAGEFVKIAIIENDIEALLLDSVLTERNIPHHMRSYHDTAYDGLFQTQKGWGHVSAPKEFEEEIIEILSDIRKQASKPGDV